MALVIQGNATARFAATNQILIQGDDGAYYSLALALADDGTYALSLSPYSGSLDGTRPFSGSVGTAFYLYDPLGYAHRFNMVSDGPGTGTYGLQDAEQTTTISAAVDSTVATARFDSGLTMTDTDGTGTHTLTVTGGELTQEG